MVFYNNNHFVFIVNLLINLLFTRNNQYGTKRLCMSEELPNWVALALHIAVAFS